MKPAEKKRWESLKKQLAAAGPRPTTAAMAMAFSDVGRNAPPTYLLEAWQLAEDAMRRFSRASSPRSTIGSRIPSAGWRCHHRPAFCISRTGLPTRRIRSRHARSSIESGCSTSAEGIANSPGDLGMQGERPTHPELLDWLATTVCEIRLERQETASNDRSVACLSTRLGIQCRGREGRSGEHTCYWRMNRRRSRRRSAPRHDPLRRRRVESGSARAERVSRTA